MAVRTTLNVSLTPELDQFVQERVAAGRFQTPSEVVREGLRLLAHHEQSRDLALASLKEKLQRGAVQAERGELIDPDETLKKIESLKLQRAKAAV